MKIFAAIFLLFSIALPGAAEERLRVIVETDAGGDPDDEQSLVRFLLYTDEWDVEGIIVNRDKARDGENVNSERTGIGIVRRQVKAYGECVARLREHDPRYPDGAALLAKTVSGLDDVEDGVKLVINAVDANDARPIWFLNWGTDHGSAKSCLRRALDQVLRERGADGYARFKQKIRLSSDNQFGDHTTKIDPPFPIWVDTFRPEIDKKRWYHRFSAVTATAGGFNLERDVLKNHGPLGALYPTNTDRKQKEGDTMTFLYLIPNGLSVPDQPGWGSWAGRYGPNENFPGKNYFHAVEKDTFNGTTSRENALARWAEDLQNDFRARMNWCVKAKDEANHPPVAKVRGELRRSAKPGDAVELDASPSSDPDGDALEITWIYYPEAGTYSGDVKFDDADRPIAKVTIPQVEKTETLHFIAIVRDTGQPHLTRYARVVIEAKTK